MIELATSADPQVRAMLARHPRVAKVAPGDRDALAFRMGPWERRVVVGGSREPHYGLMELMDNNPVVCADVVSVPSPASTLALIALGPLAAAGMLVESPTFLLNAEADEDELDAALATAGWSGGVAFHAEAMDFDGVLAGTAIAAIHTPEDLDDIDALYDERFGRSFFVRRDEESEWDARLVKGAPWALYRLRIAPDAPHSLLTIRVMADAEGKAGAAQLVHAMNVMAGYEESLGIA